MKKRILVSTGTLVGRKNGYDHKKVLESVGRLPEISGYELMMLPAYYDKLDVVARDFRYGGVVTPTIHFEKEIGAYLSRGTREDIAEAKRLIALNIKMAHLAEAKLCILHLWSGADPDGDLAPAEAAYCEINEMCKAEGLTLTVENAPCKWRDPLSIWRELADMYGDISFTLDARFAAFHDQMGEITAPDVMKKVKHIHVSDTAEIPGVFGDIRPILGLGKGKIDFDKFFKAISGYGGYITIESPVMAENGDVDIEALAENCRFVGGYI